MGSLTGPAGRPLVLAILLMTAVDCGSAQPSAPTELSVTLSSVSEVLPLNGSTQVTATVRDRNSSPAPDGTLVQFSTTAGRVQPAEAQTLRGAAVVTFFATESSGLAEIRAVAAGGSSSNPVQLSIAELTAIVSLTAVDLGGHNVLATADVQGGVATQFEWFFERRSIPEVVTTINEARYVYALPGFKDLTVRVTFSDGRRALGSGAVVVE